ncbi:hydrogenase maturation protease [Subtercola sp. PAMC28395]|uniref:hydrogenase maturation protease n=1 Tax=Subtercola sp. PAMC28395 TaxID=2846775 RepID=UPI001C0AAB7C|nr:hydrogenase maturation protease [Subtercola sp. PAMC28395]QWT23109.1 hydrogenase maturation protease [Subtercola sp. PAMC28395]
MTGVRAVTGGVVLGDPLSDDLPAAAQQPWELLNDGFDHPRIELLVIGCGNVLRGDDAAGPVVVRRLWERGGLGEHVRLADGGTSGMDVAFQMRHADRVLIVDAARTGAAPGTIYRVPGIELAALPPVSGVASHDFRWDNAIAFGHWLLGPLMPTEIEVYLIEGRDFEFGEALSAPVDAAIDAVAELIELQAEALLGERHVVGEVGHA